MNKTKNNLLTPTRYALSLGAYLLFAIAVIFFAPCLGSESISIKTAINDLIHNDISNDSQILFQQRLPRIILGFLVGASLAVTGSVFQVVLRNPLAAPSTLGITGGATIGAVLAILTPAINLHFWIFSPLQLFSLIGAIFSVFIIYFIARKTLGLSMHTLLLAGVTINILCQAFVILFSYIASPDILLTMNRWMMGGLDIVGYRELAILPPLLLPGLGILFMQTPSLNHMAMGRQLAIGQGVDVHSVQKWTFIGGSLCTAGAICLAGPIAFVGLLAPHAVRKLSGNDHRIILPAAFLAGGAFLVLCDTIARTILRPNEIPVGIITAIFGGTFFIWLLISKKNDN
ncbi:MAG: iron ABC transporter permease [Phycisphaerae bacterium]|nr:iron ABC transporter permease [Phycisphaerae bacterium]